MKKKYENAEAVVVEFTKNDDIITSSNELPVRPFGFEDDGENNQ